MISCPHCGYQVSEGTAVCPNCGKPTAAAPEKKGGKNAVVISVAIGCGCLGLVFLVAILAAIAIPNVVDAVVKAKQKRTVADMRNVGTAWMSWLTDQVEEGRSTTSLPEYPTAEELEAILVPDYIHQLPAKDGWEHPYEFWINPELDAERVLRIRSPGRDGVFEDVDPYAPEPFSVLEYDKDIIWTDGMFTHYPQAKRP